MSDDSVLLTAVENGVARLWDLKAVRPIFFAVAGDSRETIVGRYSPDGSRFVASGKDGAGRLYRVDEAGELKPTCTLDDANWMFGVAFSADSARVYTLTVIEGKTAGDHAVKAWDAATCRRLATTIGQAGVYMQGIAASRSDDRLAWSTRNGEIWIGRPDGGARKLPAFHAAPVDALDFSPDGTHLLSADRQGRMAVWNLAAGTLERELRGHSQAVYTARFSPDGALIASGGPEERILVWALNQPQGRELIREIEVKGGSNRLSFDPNGRILAVGSGARYVAMWRIPGWDKVYQLNSLVGVRSVYDFHPKRGDLAFDGENGLIRVWSRIGEPRENAPAAAGVLRQMDVFFDEIATTAADAEKPEPIAAAKAACVAAPAR
jgi:WD40 repeat protein